MAKIKIDASALSDLLNRNCKRFIPLHSFGAGSHMFTLTLEGKLEDAKLEVENTSVDLHESKELFTNTLAQAKRIKAKLEKRISEVSIDSKDYEIIRDIQELIKDDVPNEEASLILAEHIIARDLERVAYYQKRVDDMLELSKTIEITGE